MRESGRTEMDRRVGERAGSESGFALILALLSLMLLTFLGLTLATSTSTELKIATNYRWQQQALYNAEAGIEAGKRILSGLPSWTAILPVKRAVGWDATLAPTSSRNGATFSVAHNDAWGNPSRNFESWPCDKRGGGVGYGVVLDDGSPYQYKTTLFGQSLNGAFTLWVRRPLMSKPDGTGYTSDYVGPDDENTIILVSEGVAPYTGAQMSSTTAGNASVQVIEVLLSQVRGNQQAACQTRTGQAGQGAGNAGFAACDAITSGGLAGALGAAGGARGNYADQSVK
jgi:type IV pilus assembly PilX-like protein